MNEEFRAMLALLGNSSPYMFWIALAYTLKSILLALIWAPALFMVADRVLKLIKDLCSSEG